MRILICVSFLVVVFSVNVFAVEPVDEQQFMLYYQIPLGAGTAQDSKHQFGLRFDQVTHAPGDDVHISELANKTAAMDFRMGYDGIQSLKIRGVDYADYLIARAAEGETAPANAESAAATTPEAAAATPATQPAAAAPAEGATTGTAEAVPAEGATTGTAEAAKKEKGIVQKTLDELPFGVIVGVLIGVGFLIGID